MRNLRIIFFVLLFNFIVIFFAVKGGIEHKNLVYRFQEREGVTFLSALMLGLSSLCSLVIYLLKRRVHGFTKDIFFWAITAFGFLYLCMDEYFMMHEGLDDLAVSLFKNVDNYSVPFDGGALFAFGLIGLAVCIFFRRELIRHKNILLYFGLGGFCLFSTSLFDLLRQLGAIGEVVEESLKFVGVSCFFAGYFSTLLGYISTLKVEEVSYKG